MAANTDREPRGPGRPPIGKLRVPAARLAPEHTAALALLCERWSCSESEAIRRAILVASVTP